MNYKISDLINIQLDSLSGNEAAFSARGLDAIDPDKLTDEQKATLCMAAGIPMVESTKRDGDKLVITWTTKFPVGFAKGADGRLIITYNPNSPTP